MRKRSATVAHRSSQRLMQRRYQPDRRGTSRWDPNGGERRYSTGRRQEDNRPDRRRTSRWDPNGGERRYGTGRRQEDHPDAMKAALMRSWERSRKKNL